MSNFIVESSGIRLDKFLSSKIALSRTYIQKLIEEGKVTINGHSAKASLKLSTGDKVFILLPSPSPTTLTPEDIPLAVVYEDSDVIVIDKPARLPVHPAPGHLEGTLTNALLAHFPDLTEFGETIRPGIVHRLDKDTSGLLVVARNEVARLNLIEQFREHLVVKKYIALVKGHLSSKQGLIEAPIGRHPQDRKRMAVVSSGKEARTRFRVLDFLGDYTLVEITTETGRTHQIRVHFSAIGHPIFGDPTYGKKSPLLPRQFLHSCYLSFRLPQSGKLVDFHSELPSDLKNIVSKISRNYS